MPWKYTEEYYQEYTRSTWNECAAAYEPILRRFAPFHAALVAAGQPQPGHRVLDVGCGPGQPALSLAEKVGDSGYVLGVDLSERMVALAKEAAHKAEARNVEFRIADASHLELPDSTYDRAFSAFGFQIFTDPEAAAREMLRVLAPNGRAAVMIWGTGDRVPFLDVIIRPMLEHAEPDENGYIPTPYETGGPGEMVRMLTSAGFRNAREHRAEGTIHVRDAAEYLTTVLEGTPIGHSLREENPDVQRRVVDATRQNLLPYAVEGGIVLPAEYVIVTADR